MGKFGEEEDAVSLSIKPFKESHVTGIVVRNLSGKFVFKEHVNAFHELREGNIAI